MQDFCYENHQGTIAHIFCCQEQHGVRHEYILAYVVNCPQAPMGTMWLRLERQLHRSSMHEFDLKGEYTPVFRAKDSVTIASCHEALTPANYLIMEHLGFGNLSLHHLSKIVWIFSQMESDYTALKVSSHKMM